MHKGIEPAILYFGAPVVLISTSNTQGQVNLDLTSKRMPCSARSEEGLCSYIQGRALPIMRVSPLAFELSIEKVHADRALLVDPDRSHIDSDKWQPLLMNFRKYSSTGDYIYASRLLEGAQAMYVPSKQVAWRRRLTQCLLKRSTRTYRMGENNA